jgi:hypothetical protein
VVGELLEPDKPEVTESALSPVFISIPYQQPPEVILFLIL